MNLPMSERFVAGWDASASTHFWKTILAEMVGPLFQPS